VGLTPDDIVAKISSRKLLAAVLKEIGVPTEKLDSLYIVLDKKTKLPNDVFQDTLADRVPDRRMADKVKTFMETKSVSAVERTFGRTDEIKEAIDELALLLDRLRLMGVGEYCQFDPSIIRGLAYYTGIVYEIYDRGGELRAIGGGGRYDNLLRDFGGPDIPATGFGIGDSVLAILLEEKGLIEKNLPGRRLDYFVATVGEPITIQNEDGTVEKTGEDIAVELTAKLRRAGLSAAFSYKSGGLSKQLKEASAQNAQECIIIGSEFKNNELVIKDMSTGGQDLVDINEFLGRLKA
jgi:histidyl-tRNA synthetase